jgi:hypothetical protein
MEYIIFIKPTTIKARQMLASAGVPNIQNSAMLNNALTNMN